jgi:hypothetical protein
MEPTPTPEEPAGKRGQVFLPPHRPTVFSTISETARNISRFSNLHPGLNCSRNGVGEFEKGDKTYLFMQASRQYSQQPYIKNIVFSGYGR